MNFVDPTGHWFWAAIVAIAKAVGAFAAAHPVITAGIVSATVNVATNVQNISSFGDFAKFASVGYASGAVGGAAGIGTYGFLGKGVGVFWKTLISAGVGGLAGSLTQTVGNVAAFGGDLGSSLGLWAQNAPMIAGVSAGTAGVMYGGGKVIQGIGKYIDARNGVKTPIGQQQGSASNSLNVNQGEAASAKQALSAGDKKIRINVEIVDVTAPDGANVTGHRYVGEMEAKFALENGYAPNVTVRGDPKSVFYTPDQGLSSAFQAKEMYNLPNLPTHRLDLNTSSVTNTYGGNGQGIQGIEMMTGDKIPVVGVGKLGQ